MTLDEALEYVQVCAPGLWENEAAAILGDWYAVDHGDHGIIGYFYDERHACAFRLMIVNMMLNAPYPEGK